MKRLWVFTLSNHEFATWQLTQWVKTSNLIIRNLIAMTLLYACVAQGQSSGEFPAVNLAFKDFFQFPIGSNGLVYIDNRMLVGYGSNADRMEDYRTNPLPLQDSQQPFVKLEPLSTYPSGPLARDQGGKYLIQGQVPGDSATHTATDIPLSAFGPGAYAFTGVIDNTDVFFKLAQASIRGILIPDQFPTMKHRSNRKH